MQGAIFLGPHSEPEPQYYFGTVGVWIMSPTLRALLPINVLYEKLLSVGTAWTVP